MLGDMQPLLVCPWGRSPVTRSPLMNSSSV